jgi:biotin operon repressor
LGNEMSIIEILLKEKYISGNEMGKFLGISKAVVHKQINRLKQMGYTIESSSKGLYSYQKR